MVSPKRPAASRARSAPAPRPTPDPWALRPITRVHRIALIEREVRERLSRAALELVFERAEVISEGQRTSRNGKEVFHGSTMLTVNLEELCLDLREPCDAGTAQRLATLLRADPTGTARVKAIAGREVERITGRRPKAVSVEVTVSSRGAKVLLDVDTEATL